GFLAVAAEDAAQHVDVVALRVPLPGGVPFGLRVLRGFHVDRVRGADRGAQAAADAALEAVLVPVQLVQAAESRIHLHPLLGIADRDRLLEEVRQGDRKTLHELGDHLSLPGGETWAPRIASSPVRLRSDYTGGTAEGQGAEPYSSGRISSFFIL